MQNTSQTQLRIVENASVDKARWDEVITSAANGRVYAMSWYLDRVSEDWCCLVWADYAYVMPLTIRKKMGVSMLVQPCYSQQLGIFPEPAADIACKFLQYIEMQFQVIKVNFNSHNLLMQQPHVKPMVNLLLNLDFPYTGLYAQYSPHTRRHLKRAESMHLTFSEGIHTGDYIEFKKRHQPAKIYRSCIQAFKRLSAYLAVENKGFFCGVYSQENELCAAAFFVFHGKRLIYLNGVSSDKGKQVAAMYFLMDQIIRRYSGTALFLDFEGSVIPGISRFFRGFGAHEEIYYHFSFNKLPSPLRWIIK